MNAKDLDAAIADPKTYGDEAGMYALLARLRREDPVHWTQPEGYNPFWTITRHAHIMEIERQQTLFINAPRTALRTVAQEDRIRAVTGSNQVARTVIQMDQPDHRAFRALTQAWFMPTRLKVLNERMVELASQFVDRLRDLDGRCDFVKDIAVWYPLRAIMLILGVPEEDEAFMLKLTQQHFANTDPNIAEKHAAQPGDAARELFAYFTDLTAKRRLDPRDDIVTLLADATIAGKPIGDYERNSYYFILAVAGHDTTSASIAGTLLALMQNPDQFSRLRADRSLMAAAMDEGVRWTSPVKHFFRTATVDYELAGRTIRAGESLLLSYPAANRDEQVFKDPDSFRIDRKPNPHLAFGFGPHLCLGQHFAKLEMRTLFDALLDRVDEFELAGEPKLLEVNFVGGLKELPIAYRMRDLQPA